MSIARVRTVFCIADKCMETFMAPVDCLGPFFCSEQCRDTYSRNGGSLVEGTATDVEEALNAVKQVNTHPVVTRSYPPRGPMTRIFEDINELTVTLAEMERPQALESDALGG